MIYNTLTAAFLALAGFSLALRHILLSPRNVSFPCAPEVVRAAMFIFAGILLWAAVLFWGSYAAPYAGRAAGAIVVLAGVLALYQVALVWNVLTQRRNWRTWRRMRRYENVAMGRTRTRPF